MTCDQFDELWRRLDQQSGPLMDAATGAEVLRERHHFRECERCRGRALERHATIERRKAADPLYAMEMAAHAADIEARMGRELSTDEELGGAQEGPRCRHT